MDRNEKEKSQALTSDNSTARKVYKQNNMSV